VSDGTYKGFKIINCWEGCGARSHLLEPALSHTTLCGRDTQRPGWERNIYEHWTWTKYDCKRCQAAADKRETK